MVPRQSSTLRHSAWGADPRGDTASGDALEATASTGPIDQGGYCLLNGSNLVIAATDRASRLLNYPPSERTQLNESCIRKIRALANARRRMEGTAWRAVLRSGRRRYLCRAIPLTAQPAVPLGTPTLLLIERPRVEPTPPVGRTVLSQEAWQRVTSALALSARESEILQAIFEDQKECCIAANLGISSHTVHTHLERIYRKLHVSSRVALVVRVFAEYLSKQST